MLSFIAMSISYIYGTLITASAELKVFNLIFVVGIIINWCLNLYLIPISGASGAALATLVTQFTVMIAQTILAFKKFKLKINFNLAFRYTVLILFGILSFHFLQSNIQFNWIFNLVSSLILFTLISILIGFIRLKWVFGMAFE
jgi:O-antigen/teichoic acid export membrane protein